MVVFSYFDCFFEAVLLSVLDAFLAEAAIVNVLNINNFPLIIEPEHLPRTLRHHSSSLLLCQILIDFFLVKLNDGLLSHDDCGDWTPFGMDLTNAFLGNQVELKGLVLSKLGDCDGGLFISDFIHVDYW